MPEHRKQTAETLFGKIYGEMYDKEIRGLVERFRFEALLLTIGQSKSALNRRLVQVNDHAGPYKLMYEFEAEVDSGTLVYFYDEDYASHKMLLTLKVNLKDTAPPIVEPVVTAAGMFGPILEDLTSRIEASKKTDSQIKIFVPAGFYCFTWTEQWINRGFINPGLKGQKTPHGMSIKAENFDEARKELYLKVFRSNLAFDFEVFWNNQSRKFQNSIDMDNYLRGK